VSTCHVPFLIGLTLTLIALVLPSDGVSVLAQPVYQSVLPDADATADADDAWQLAALDQRIGGLPARAQHGRDVADREQCWDCRPTRGELGARRGVNY
jgi:hypothetical protein